jgi:hypothetical protein
LKVNSNLKKVDSKCQSLKSLEKQLCSNLDTKLSVQLTSLPTKIKKMTLKEFRNKYNESLETFIEKEDKNKSILVEQYIDKLSTPFSKQKSTIKNTTNKNTMSMKKDNISKNLTFDTKNETNKNEGFESIMNSLNNLKDYENKENLSNIINLQDQLQKIINSIKKN